jgi:hypothetical protein
VTERPNTKTDAEGATPEDMARVDAIIRELDAPMPRLDGATGSSLGGDFVSRGSTEIAPGVYRNRSKTS